MRDKFKNIPIDKETKIIMESPMKWSGITAESIIFLSDDIKDMDDEALEKDVRDSLLVQGDSKVTISRGDEYTFVNFNFATYAETRFVARGCTSQIKQIRRSKIA